MIKVITNEQHVAVAIKNRRILTSYHKAMRCGNVDDLKVVKQGLESEINNQNGSKNVVFLQLVLHNINKRLGVA